jgi:hypothetical protein
VDVRRAGTVSPDAYRSGAGESPSGREEHDMTWRGRLSGAVLILGLSACASVQTSTNFDPNAKQALRTYRTYAWLPMKDAKTEQDARIYNPIIQARVRQSVDRELAARGFQKVAPGQKPDFKVGWHGAVDEKVAVDTMDNYYGYAWDPWYDPFYGPIAFGGSGFPGDSARVREYKQGTLVLDVVDAGSNKLVWRGTAQSQLSEYMSATKSQKLIDRSVDKLLKDFPPEPHAR